MEVKLDPICCSKPYPVYGEEQPVSIKGECVVNVDVEEVVLEEVEPDQVIQPGPATSSGPRFDSAASNRVDAVADYLKSGIENLKATSESYKSIAQSVVSPFLFLFSELKDKIALTTIGKIFTQVEEYHTFLDEDVFGKAIAKISSYQKSQDLSSYLANKEQGQCDATNPRPDCVIEFAMCSYEKYAGVLFQEAGSNLGRGQVTTDDIQSLLATLQKRDLALLKEFEDTKQALDTAIAVYSQYYQTYRIHLAFKEVIEGLVKVRNMTSFMRTLVGCIPNKFQGVATTKCN